MDKEVLKHMLAILTESDKGKDSIQRLYSQNIKVLTLKAIQALFKILNVEFIAFLTEVGVIDTLMQFL